MTDAGKGGGEGGGPSLSPDRLLADLMAVGTDLDGHQAREGELASGIDGIASRRTELEEQKAADLRQLDDDYNARQGELGEERAELEAKQAELEADRASAQRRATRLGGRLRKLATAPNARRSTLLTYAAFAATKPNFTAEAVTNLTGLDEAVQGAAGQPFLLVQGHNLAFGKIHSDSDGLLVGIEPARGQRSERVTVELPLAHTNTATHASRHPYFGWVSTGFDQPRDMFDTWDSVLERRAEDSEVTNPDGRGGTMSHFNLQEGDLPLLSPTVIRLGTAEDAAPPAEAEAGQDDVWEKDDLLFTGPTAVALLHRVVDARLTLLDREIFEGDSASAELGRVMGITARLGIRLDPRKIPAHERLIGVTED